MVLTNATKPRDVARLIRFRHSHIIDRLRTNAYARPWHGRTPIGLEHKDRAPSLTDPDLRISLIFTLDHGAHASGWWRNSQYETCLHLSIAALTKERSPQIVEAPAIERRA